MQVRITVSRPGGKIGDSFSHSITMKDAQTLEEVQQKIAVEFGELFPKYASLEAPTRKKDTKNGKV